MGLYGNVIVEPADPDYWPPVHREIALTLDDILIEDGKVAPFSRAETTHSAMGRFGNVLLVGGQTDPSLAVKRGEVVRFYFTNTANTRVFRVALPGARIKLVGGDSGHVEHEQFVDDVILAPGSGKSSLIHGSFLPQHPGAIVIDQSAVGAQHRSTPATYTGIMDDVRKVFAAENGVEASLFSFNLQGRLRDLQGARRHLHRPRLPRRGAPPVRGVQRQAVQGRRPRSHREGQIDQRRARDDRGAGPRDVPAEGHRPEARGDARRGARLPDARAAAVDPVGRRVPAHQARERAGTRRAAST